VSLIPYDVLWSTSTRGEAHVSPDGRWIAYLASEGGVANAVVRDLADDTERQLTQHSSGHGVEQLRWAADSRHLLLTRDEGGDENYRLEAVDVETGGVRVLVDDPSVRALILGVDVRRPDLVAVGLNLDDARFHDVYLIDVATGERTKTAANPGFTRWAVDQQLEPRAGVRGLDDGGAELVLRDDDSGHESWRTIVTVGPDDAMQLLFDLYPIRFDATGTQLWFVGPEDGDTLALVRVDLTTLERTVVARRDGGDVMWVTFDPASGVPLVAVAVHDRGELIACSDDTRADVEHLTATLAGDLQVPSVSTDGRFWTVTETVDTGSARHHLYDREDRTTRLLYVGSEQLDAAALAPMEPVRFTARDGLEIPLYLTFPVGSSRRDLPTVVMVHGGPANRYFWGYHPQVQFFADRGYLVVQVNFRGSLGYGRAFMAAGDGEWARAMHHDVVDTIRWVVDQGYADRERVAMWGTSYGGYETLITVTHDPDLVRCAIPVVAPTSLITLMDNIPDYWQAERTYFARVLGDLDDKDNLWDRSPLRLADQIKAPLLLMYGGKDPRVHVQEAEQLVEVLERNGLPHELHVFPDEGHNLAYTMTPEHRVVYAERLESFLAEHLGGLRSETVTGLLSET
jgi:dipeptidyl aminopeptidase/acylaminoacyl peptidase